MIAQAVPWEDLLAVPFLAGGDDPSVGLDCYGQAREINRRLGRNLPDLGAIRPTPDASAEGVSSLVRLEGPIEVGDLLLDDPERLGYPSHVTTVVRPGWGLSVSARHGRAYCWPLSRVLYRCGIWRARA